MVGLAVLRSVNWQKKTTQNSVFKPDKNHQKLLIFNQI